MRVLKRLSGVFGAVLLILFCFLSQACFAEYVVKAVYFVPSDAEVNEINKPKFGELLKDAQRFYQQQMLAHGYGKKTFRLEADATDNVILHQVRGRFTHEHYGKNQFSILNELPKHLTGDNIPFIFLEGSALVRGKCGFGGFSFNTNTGIIGTIAVVPAFGSCAHGFGGREYVTHEIGHAFGLQHDFRDDAYIMSYGGSADKLSADAAKWLSVSPYFNTVRIKNNPPNLTRIYPTRNVNGNLVVSADFSDPDGLFQAMLFVDENLYASKSISGVKSTVSFTTQLTSNIGHLLKMQVVDIYGNYKPVRITQTQIDYADHNTCRNLIGPGEKPIRKMDRESDDIHNEYLSTVKADTRNEVVYLSFIGGNQPIPNACGLNPKNPSDEWAVWGGPIDTDNASIGEGVGRRNRIVIGAVYYERGIGTSVGKIVYDLTGKNYIRFEGYAGLADETDAGGGRNAGCGHGGSCVFSFEIDGRQVFKTTTLLGNDWGENVKPFKCAFDIPSDARELTINIEDAGDGICADHGVIGDAKLIYTANDTPTNQVENNVSGDVNNDGEVNLVDLVIVASNFGAVINGTMNPNPDVNGDGKVDIDDLLTVIDKLNVPEAPQLLTTDVKQTQLLQNYPNPFNPETWIPYQLSKDADVNIT